MNGRWISGVLIAAMTVANEGALLWAQEAPPIAAQTAGEPVAAMEGGTVTETVSETGQVTLDFKDADIQNVLRILAMKSGMNIVASSDVTGTVTVRLVDVSWEKALDVILRTYGYGYERQENIITVMPREKLLEMRKAEKEFAEVQPVVSKVFTLKFMDAGDAKKVMDPQLSPQGKITVYEVEGRKGWTFGAVQAGSGGGGGTTSGPQRVTAKEVGRSKSLVVTDIPSYLEKIEKLIAQLDVKPKQIMIEARIMEVNRDRLKDIGIELGTSATGASTVSSLSALRDKGIKVAPQEVTGSTLLAGGGQSLSLGTTDPSIFTSKTSGLTPLNTGMQFFIRKLVGTQFEAVIHALEEDLHANTLSAPRLVTLDNQPATILVGEKFPILESQVTGTSSSTTTQSLSYYQDIGIQLRVVPQVSADNYIDMIVHPTISEVGSIITTTGSTQYPRLNIREAEVQILMQDGETIVIGGLLKDLKRESRIGVPILSQIPLLGLLFQRRTTDVEKIDLLIFITAKIVKPGEVTEEEIAAIQMTNQLANEAAVHRAEAIQEKGKKKKKAKKEDS